VANFAFNMNDLLRYLSLYNYSFIMHCVGYAMTLLPASTRMFSIYLQLLMSRAESCIMLSLYTVVHKTHHFYFLNSSMKHWPILIIFGMQH